ncbi:MAG: phenylalanine--tRNA ligase subunit beta [Selenomonadaceae bacterium]|nr:phenylalanine--tRNA ligase subunit beta [Selenomonadaceae bacterium]
MQVSTKWLKDYIDIDLTADELAEKFTLAGIPVENVIHAGEGLEKVVTGKIEELKAHPDSDHLQICQMDVGAENLLQIVTGAQNVAEGQIVPVALVGANLPCGKKISKGKMRGVASNGMLCSSDELKIEGDASGIYILPEDTKVGIPVAEVLGLDDDILEFELTANRGDCFSVVGLVRELAVLTKKTPRFPEIKVDENDDREASKLVKIGIAAPELCSRFSGRVLTDVKLAPSPDWIVKRLEGAGMRAINNVVDVTNFVMLELGQPLHAYDFDEVVGHELTARQAVAGEALHTLDDTNRLAKGGELVIADAEKAAGLAGIMGGFETEITEKTSTVILEAACFNSASIRRTSRAVGIHSEASGRFERGTNEKGTIAALDRVAQLLQEMGACKVCKGVVDVYPNPKDEVKIKFSPAQINARLGTNFSVEEIIDVLTALGFDVESTGKVDELTDEVVDRIAAVTKKFNKTASEIGKKSNVENFVSNIGATFSGIFKKADEKIPDDAKERVESFVSNFGGLFRKADEKIPDETKERVEDIIGNIGGKFGELVKTVDMKISSTYLATVPEWRNDVTLPEDLSEEVARIFGFDKIPSTLPKGNQQGHQSATQNFIDRIKTILVGLGMCEELSFAFTSSAMFDKMHIPADSQLRQAVPIMNPLTDEAPLLRTTLLASIFENAARNYSRKNEDIKLFDIAPVFFPKALPVTEQPIERQQLVGVLMGRREPKGWSQNPAQVDFYDAKGIVEELLAGLSINNYFVEAGEHYALHPGKTAVFKKGRDVLVTVGEVHPAVAEALGIKKKIYVFEAEVDTLQKFAAKKFTFESLPKYPSISRDLAILVDHDTAAGDVEKVIAKNGGQFFKGVTLFDVYTGDRISADKKSLAFAIDFRSNERTLKDEEADEAFKNILSAVEKEFGATLRS